MLIPLTPAPIVTILTRRKLPIGCSRMVYGEFSSPLGLTTSLIEPIPAIVEKIKVLESESENGKFEFILDRSSYLTLGVGEKPITSARNFPERDNVQQRRDRRVNECIFLCSFWIFSAATSLLVIDASRRVHGQGANSPNWAEARDLIGQFTTFTLSLDVWVQLQSH